MTAGIVGSEMAKGPGRIFWGPAGTETELGITEEGLDIFLSMPTSPEMADEFGDEPVKETSLGTLLTVAVTLKQWSNAQLLIALPGSIEGTGTVGASWNAGLRAGVDLSSSTYAKQLRWHPLQTTDTSDYSDNIRIHLCNLRLEPGSKIQLQARTARKLQLVGQAFRDTSQSTVTREFLIKGTDTS